jgi:uncharacterized membrane protein YphA (DoxX/SURF4 family)
MQSTHSLLPAIPLMRVARVACLWGVIGIVQVSGFASPQAWTCASVVAAVGLSILLLAAEGTAWGSVLSAAVLLATSPTLQASWVTARDLQTADSLTFLKTLLILAGLLLLARLEAGFKEGQARDAAEAGSESGTDSGVELRIPAEDALLVEGDAAPAREVGRKTLVPRHARV